MNFFFYHPSIKTMILIFNNISDKIRDGKKSDNTLFLKVNLMKNCFIYFFGLLMLQHVNHYWVSLWDFMIQMDHLISARRPDLVIANNKKENVLNSGLCHSG